MFDIGTGELFLILVVVLIAFGPKKLPELAQSLGRGLREFRRAQREFTDQINSAIETEHQKQTRTVSRAPTTTMRSGSVSTDAAQPDAGAPALATGGVTMPFAGHPPADEPMIAPPHVTAASADVHAAADTHTPVDGATPAVAPLPPDDTPIGQTPARTAHDGSDQLPIFSHEGRPQQT